MTFSLEDRDFSYWDVDRNRLARGRRAATGSCVGSSSRDIRLEDVIARGLRGLRSPGRRA